MLGRQHSFLLVMIITDSVICDSNCSLATMVVVESCPTNERDKHKLAEKKQCEQYAKVNNCTEDPSHFQYHCVINPYRNETIEVCALNKTINGFCAEFNPLGEIIQDNYYHDCSEEDKCPEHYHSAHAYKYKACYNFSHVFGKENITTLPKITASPKISTFPNDIQSNDITTLLSPEIQASVHSSANSYRCTNIVLNGIILGMLVAIAIAITILFFKRDSIKESRNGEYHAANNSDTDRHS